MRRVMLTLVGLGLFFCGTNVALAGGPHHGGHHGHANYGRGYSHHRHGHGYGYRPYCGPRRVVAYPAYPVYPAYPAYSAYAPNFGFGVAGRNFSLFYQQ